MNGLTPVELRALADFRHQIRRFQRYCDYAARAERLAPQQHQLLLGVHALTDENGGPTVSALAEWLIIQHHSTVGLIDRLVKRDLVARNRDESNRRLVRIRLTASGAGVLQRLSLAHRAELRSAGPHLVGSLGTLLATGEVPDSRAGIM